MNNIHEKDWAEESWSGHTGMDSFSDYNIGDEQAEEVLGNQSEAENQGNTEFQREPGRAVGFQQRSIITGGNNEHSDLYQTGSRHGIQIQD